MITEHSPVRQNQKTSDISPPQKSKFHSREESNWMLCFCPSHFLKSTTTKQGHDASESLPVFTGPVLFTHLA